MSQLQVFFPALSCYRRFIFFVAALVFCRRFIFLLPLSRRRKYKVAKEKSCEKIIKRRKYNNKAVTKNVERLGIAFLVFRIQASEIKNVRIYEKQEKYQPYCARQTRDNQLIGNMKNSCLLLIQHLSSEKNTRKFISLFNH